MRLLALAAAATFLGLSSPAFASEIFGGLLVHDVDTPITRSGIERGLDVQLGWRGDRIEALGFIGRPSPYVFGSVNTEGGVNFAAAGISWKIGGRAYFRPGIGLAIHDGPGEVVPGDNRIDFGSRILFEPEAAIGYQVNDRLSVEAAWVHLSHAQLFGGQNPGMDSIGLRVNYGF
ncbi:MAG TPA: acyloxyacyl hydrolase [Allosphingosinicella sp.]|uniref:acyloxyacyl hydrolase n=1 Tax=Allosphingosinicella sp. TaxID=2823234 RepID=UPI002EDB5565